MNGKGREFVEIFSEIRDSMALKKWYRHDVGRKSTDQGDWRV